MSDERQASERAVELVVELRSALLAGESRVARQELLDYMAALEADRARLEWLGHADNIELVWLTSICNAPPSFAAEGSAGTTYHSELRDAIDAAMSRRATVTDGRVFYGPHPCATCGVVIAKASRQQGGEEFEYPEGPIYPNTEWKRHTCVTAPAQGDR